MNNAIGQRMIDYLPDYYSSSRVMCAKFEATGQEIEAIYAALEYVLDQYFVATAADPTIFEFEYGLPTNLDQPIDQRKSIILAKKRGYGPATTSLIYNVAQAFENGEIEIIEDFTAYTVIIKFISTIGIPPGLEDIKTALKRVIPAHLHVIYELRYLTWNELEGLNLTWDELDGLNLTWDELEVYKPGGS